MTPSGVLPVFGIWQLNGFSMSSSSVCYLFFTLECGLQLLSVELSIFRVFISVGLTFVLDVAQKMCFFL